MLVSSFYLTLSLHLCYSCLFAHLKSTIIIDEDTHAISITLQLPLDLAVDYLSKHHVPQIIVALFILWFATLVPILLLALYPVRAFRLLLFKCCPSRFMGALTILVESFTAATGMD